MMTRQATVGIEGREALEPGGWPVHHGVGDRLVERHHRIVRHPRQQTVEGQNLRPVGGRGVRGFVMNRRDRGLQLIGTDAATRQRVGDEGDAFGNRAPIPFRAILLGQRNQVAVRSALAPAGAHR